MAENWTQGKGGLDLRQEAPSDEFEFSDSRFDGVNLLELVPPKSNGTEYTRDDLVRHWQQVPVGDPDGHEVVRGILETLTPTDMDIINRYARAINRANPDVREFQQILSQFSCDPDELLRLSVPLGLMSNKWVLSGGPTEGGGAQMNLYAGALVSITPHPEAFGVGKPVSYFHARKECPIS